MSPGGPECPGGRWPALSRVRLYPIKSLDPVEVSEACIGPTGGLVNDRVWALYATDGRWINGKRTPSVHFVHASFAPDLSAVRFSVSADHSGPPSAEFSFPSDFSGASHWLSSYFGEPVAVRQADAGFPDDDLAPGPTLVSTASLEAVCSWFPELSVESARLRFRANLEIGGMRAFAEDQLFAAEKGTYVRFDIGEVAFEGSNPCARCVVPTRDPVNGEAIANFQKRFVSRRQTSMPPWAATARFDHFYRFALNTRVPASECGKILRVGDALTLREP